jgi:hypothetical protein
MIIDPHGIVSPWAWRAGMDHGDTRNEEGKDKNEQCYFGEG